MRKFICASKLKKFYRKTLNNNWHVIKSNDYVNKEKVKQLIPLEFVNTLMSKTVNSIFYIFSSNTIKCYLKAVAIEFRIGSGVTLFIIQS